MGQKKRGSAHSFLLMLLLLASIFSGSRGSSSPRSSSLMIGHGNGCFVCQYTRATKRRERGKKLGKSRSDRTSISSSPSPTWSSFFCAPCPPPVDESMFTSRNQWLWLSIPIPPISLSARIEVYPGFPLCFHSRCFLGCFTVFFVSSSGKESYSYWELFHYFLRASRCLDLHWHGKNWSHSFNGCAWNI